MIATSRDLRKEGDRQTLSKQEKVGPVRDALQINRSGGKN